MAEALGEIAWEEELKLSGGIAAGILAIDLLGDAVRDFLGKFIPAEWLEVAVELAIGVVLLYAGYKWITEPAWTDFVKQAGRAGIGVGIKNIVRTLVFPASPSGGGHSSPKSPKQGSRTTPPPAGIRFETTVP